MSEFICRRCGAIRSTDSAALVTEYDVEADEAGQETGLVRMRPECHCGGNVYKERDGVSELEGRVEDLWSALDQLTDDILPKLDDIDQKTTCLWEAQEAALKEDETDV